MFFKPKIYWNTFLRRGVLAIAPFIALDLFCEYYFYKVHSPKIQMIIIEKTPIPRFAFVLSSLPLAINAYLKYGERSFTLVPANLESTLHAFSTARYLIVATHGIDGSLQLDDGFLIGPTQVNENPSLKHIYFGACEAGIKFNEWSKKAPNAEIIANNGLTTPLYGWLFLVFDSWNKV